MSYYYVLFNSLSCNGKGENNAKRLNSFKFDGELVYLDIKTIKNYSDFFDTLSPDDSIIICGGDGTLNKFINDTNSLVIKNKILYYACGTGNDFLRDIGVPHGNRPVEINT